MDIKFSAPAVVKSITGASIGGALIADGVINTSTGPIIAGMVTIIGTAAVVVAGQYWAARNKAEAERRAIELRADNDERASLLKDYQDTCRSLQLENNKLRDQLIDAERRAARNNSGGESQQQSRQQHT